MSTSTKQAAKGLATEAAVLAGIQKGQSQRTIAKEIGSTQPAVSKALRRATSRMLAQMPTEARALKHEASGRLEWAIVEAAAFTLSKLRGRPDRRWLLAFARLVGEQRRLWALDSPSRTHISLTARTIAPEESMTDAALLAQAEQELQHLRVVFEAEQAANAATAELDGMPTLSQAKVYGQSEGQPKQAEDVASPITSLM